MRLLRNGMVLHATTVHRRDDVRIFHKMCTSLVSAGFRVVLLVGDGKGDEHVGGVRIVDIGRSPGGRALRMSLQPLRMMKAIRELGPDLLHFHDPELLPVGRFFSERGLPVVYDVHEDVPRQVMTKPWIPDRLKPLFARGFEALEGRLARKLSVSAATPHIASRFVGVARETATVPNFPRVEELAPPTAGPGRIRSVCYVGGLSRSRGLTSMVRALPLVPGLRLLLCGAFQDSSFERDLRREPGWSQVDYLGWIDRRTVASVMARCRAGLVTLLPHAAYTESLPIKMFEYMSAGLPVVASDFPLWRRILEHSGAGVCVDPQDPAAIGSVLRALVDDPGRVAAMGMAGRRAVQTSYNWQQAEAVLFDLYARLTATPGGIARYDQAA